MYFGLRSSETSCHCAADGAGGVPCNTWSTGAALAPSLKSRTADLGILDLAAQWHEGPVWGSCVEAYLPPSLALWLLDLIEQGKFLDPSEAVFVILGEHKELETHADLRRELLKRSIQAAIDDPRPGLSGEEMKARLGEMFKKTLPEPPRWEKRSRR